MNYTSKNLNAVYNGDLKLTPREQKELDKRIEAINKHIDSFDGEI